MVRNSVPSREPRFPDRVRHPGLGGWLSMNTPRDPASHPGSFWDGTGSLVVAGGAPGVGVGADSESQEDAPMPLDSIVWC